MCAGELTEEPSEGVETHTDPAEVLPGTGGGTGAGAGNVATPVVGPTAIVSGTCGQEALTTGSGPTFPRVVPPLPHEVNEDTPAIASATMKIKVKAYSVFVQREVLLASLRTVHSTYSHWLMLIVGCLLSDPCRLLFSEFVHSD